MTAHHVMSEDCVVVRFEGEIDMAVADEFWTQLQAGLAGASTGAVRPLIIDLEAVDFCGSSALNDVMRCHDEGAGIGVAVGLVGTSSIVGRLIHAAGLDDLIAVYPTIDDARRALAWATQVSPPARPRPPERESFAE